MKPHERDLALIEIILEDYATLGKRLARFSVTEHSFVNDRSDDGELAYDAVMSPVYRIAEDALHLSEELMNSFPDYPWKNIRGFRNFVAHGYREVDRAIAWKVVHEDIPQLATLLEQYKLDG
ncbi:MAG TPA: DUF86 domain-containing protein [Candidatus Rubneribacter avistercoris]|nr:DUF86 domain-containing protein [Candidatus Rubneribacter avistercoris]